MRDMDTGLEAAAVAVRLRRFWLGEAHDAQPVRDSDLGEVWREVAVRRVAARLTLFTPYDFGRGDPLEGGLGAWLTQRVHALSEGAVREVGWDFDQRAQRPFRRARSTDLDIHAPGDPGPDELDDVLARLRRRLPADVPAQARDVLGRIGLAAASRHRLWFVATDAAAEQAVRRTPGAAYALHAAVRGVQGAEPLYRVVVDPTLEAVAVGGAG